MINRNAFGVGVAATAPGAATLPAAHAAAAWAAAHKHPIAAATEASVGRGST
jgi:hypothetical protein